MDATTLGIPKYPRGVYLSRVLSSDGEPVVFAVDSRGWEAAKIVLRGIITRAAAERLLWAKLDALDPIMPRLSLVSPRTS